MQVLLTATKDYNTNISFKTFSGEAVFGKYFGF